MANDTREARENRIFPRQETLRVEPSRNAQSGIRNERPVIYFEDTPVWLVDGDEAGSYHESAYNLLQVNDEVVVEILADKPEDHYNANLIAVFREQDNKREQIYPRTMAEPTEQNPPTPQPEPAPEAIPPEPVLNPQARQGRERRSERLAEASLLGEIRAKFQAYERPKFPELNEASVPKLLKLIVEIREQKEREMVEQWASDNDDVIRDRFPGVKTVSLERKKQALEESEPAKAGYFAEEDETGEYRQLEFLFFDLDQNKTNASPETLISLVHFLNKRQIQLESQSASARTANDQEALQRIKEQMRDYLLLEEDVHRVISGGDIPDMNTAADGLIAGDLNSRWQTYLAQPVSDQAILAREAQLGHFLSARHIQVLQELGYAIQPVYKANKWTVGLTSKMVGVRVVDPAGNPVTSETPVNLATRLLNNEFRQKKTDEFKAELLPGALQEVKIAWLRDNFIDTSNLEEQFDLTRKEIVSKTLARRLEAAQRHAGKKEEVKEYKETLENQGLNMKGVIQTLMEQDPDVDEEEALRQICRVHGISDQQYNAFSPEDKQNLRSAKNRGVGYWVSMFMGIMRKVAS